MLLLTLSGTSLWDISSVAQLCLTLCHPINHSTPGLPVHHQLPEFNQTHVHWAADAIQPFRPLSSPSLPALNLFQHKGIFKRFNSLHQVAKVLAFQLQRQSFQWTPRTHAFRMDGWISLQSKGLSRVFSNITSINFLALSFLYSPTLTSRHDYWKNHSLDKVMSLLFNMLSSLLITFLPRTKCLLISWLQSPSAVILEPQK